MSDASNEVVASPSDRTMIVGVNDVITRALLLKLAIISIYCVAIGWDGVIAYKEEMSINYVIFRYFGFLLMYVYVFRLVCCFLPSYRPHTSLKSREKLLAIILLMLSVSMFCICYTWETWDVLYLMLGVVIAAISLAQLIYGMDKLDISRIILVTFFGYLWGLCGLAFNIESPMIICFFFIAFSQMAFMYDIYCDGVYV